MIYFWQLQVDLDITSKQSYTAFLEYQFLLLMQGRFVTVNQVIIT
jgi:hypothetical protein